MGYGIFGQKITGIRDIKTPPNGASLTEYEIKNLGTPDSPLQNKKFRDHQWKNVTNLHKSNL